MVCQNCGKEFTPMHGRMKFCSKHCRHATQWRVRQAAMQKTANIKPEPYQRKQREVFITDEEQRKLDHEVFIKSALHYETKIYKPGTPEFDAVAKTVTPIDRVPKYRHHEHRYNRGEI